MLRVYFAIITLQKLILKHAFVFRLVVHDKPQYTLFVFSVGVERKRVAVVIHHKPYAHIQFCSLEIRISCYEHMNR